MKLLWFYYVSLCYWSRKLVSFSQPSDTKLSSNISFLLIGHSFAKALSVSGFGDYFNLLLFRHLETEYIRHCIPSNVASGLSSLPLPYMYVDEIAKSDQPTTQELPSRDRLSCAQTYLKLISVFTTLVVSPEKLKHISQEKLDELSSHVSVT